VARAKSHPDDVIFARNPDIKGSSSLFMSSIPDTYQKKARTILDYCVFAVEIQREPGVCEERGKKHKSFEG
jgi:hypothetical protein